MLHVDLHQPLNDFDLDVQFEHEGGILILFGASGAGKTQTLRLIAGTDTPARGRITFGDDVWFDAAGRKFVRTQSRRVGFIFQHHNLFPHMTAVENIRYGARSETDVERWMSVFDVSHLAERPPSRLSGGERQRVAVVRALVTKPNLLLMDEPLSAVDLPTRQILLDEFRALHRASGIPMVYVTHSVSEAYRLGDRVLILDRGRVVRDGVPIDVFQTPTTLPLAALAGTENVLTGKVVAQHPEDNTTDLRIGDAVFHVPLCQADLNESAVVAVRPEDILVALSELADTSARNQFQGVITAVERGPQCSILVQIPGGPVLRARITPTSLDALDLGKGKSVYLLIKAWAFHPIEQSSISGS